MSQDSVFHQLKINCTTVLLMQTVSFCTHGKFFSVAGFAWSILLLLSHPQIGRDITSQSFASCYTVMHHRPFSIIIHPPIASDSTCQLPCILHHQRFALCSSCYFYLSKCHSSPQNIHRCSRSVECAGWSLLTPPESNLPLLHSSPSINAFKGL